MPATIAVLGTLDTKGEEHAFVAEQIRSHGLQALLIDVGTGSPATVAVDIPRETVAAAGNVDLAEVVAQGDRGAAVAAMSRAAPELFATTARGRTHSGRGVARRRWRHGDRHRSDAGFALGCAEADGLDLS